jgi:hypothetical protein
VSCAKNAAWPGGGRDAKEKVCLAELAACSSLELEIPMRRALRRSLLVLGMAVAASPAQQALALPFAAPAAETPIRLAATKKTSPHDRKEAAKKKKEAEHQRHMHLWILGREGSKPALTYSRMNGDDAKISLSCQADSGLVRIVVYDVPAKGMRPGDGGRVRLSNGYARVEVAATALPNEKNPRAVDLGGITKVSPRLFSLLKSGDTMVVEVPGRTTGVPLKSLEKKAEAFERACLAQR